MATPLEQFVHNVRTLSSQGNFRDLCDLLCKSTDILLKNGQHLDAVMECLQQHSLGMLSVLIIKLSLPPPSQSSNSSQTQPADYQEIRYTQVQEFITTCVAEQIRYAPDAFAELCHMLTQQLVDAKLPMRGIDLLSIAIKKLQTSDCQLTLVHADLCQLCLLAKCFKPALKLLDIDITSIATTEVKQWREDGARGDTTGLEAELSPVTGTTSVAAFKRAPIETNRNHYRRFKTPTTVAVSCLSLCSEVYHKEAIGCSLKGGGRYPFMGVQFDPKYFLLYYYYGGMIYAAVKNYERALYFFEVVISTPAMAVSHIMLEAYKKYILVSLILNGKVSSIPKYVSQVVGRFIKPLSQAYHELSTVYATNSTEELRQLVTKHSELLTRDGNMGLAKQVISSLYKKNIQRLTKTFLTLSLSDVASRVQLSGPSDAEKYVLHMIEDGEIFATINQKDGMVIFHDDPEKYNSPTMLCRLEDEMSLCTELDRRIQKMEEEILVNPQYVKKSCGAAEEDLTPGQGTKISYLM